jgi:diguanylate cyclase (GGDEF)-like protein
MSSWTLSWTHLGWLAALAGANLTWLWIWSLESRLAATRAEFDKLHATSKTDSLTGLGSQRYFDLERWPAAVRSGSPLAVAYIDLDGLTAINNRQGHDAGDRWLRIASEALVSVTRGGDEVFRRYNAGDEFVAIFRGSPDTARLAARILGALRAQGVRASLGVAACSAARADDRDAALQRRRLVAMAEEACRQAKARGGDCVVLADAARISTSGVESLADGATAAATPDGVAA